MAKVRRNWIIPYSAMWQQGHVRVSFNVHKDGSISDVVVTGPCEIAAFNESSSRAIAASHPAPLLPRDYPVEKAAITITFYYNESPPKK